MYVCPYCGEFTGQKYDRYLRHIKFVHSNEPNFTISCTYCGQGFTRYSSFKSHLDRKHQQQCAQDHSLDEENDDPDHGIIDVPIEDDDQGDEEADDIDQDTDIEKITKFIALFVLKTKEVNLVSQQAIDSMLDNTKTLVDHCLQTLSGEVKLCLAQNGLNWAEIDGLKEVFKNQSSIYETALGPVANEYLQVKYLVEKLNFVQPKSIVLSQEGHYEMKDGKMKYIQRKETFQYIPILETLKALLNHPDILTEACNSHTSTDGKIRDFCDGEYFKSHQLFGVVENALIIHGYYDEFQVTNPLGSRTKIHKLGAFYFILGNIRAEYRSCVNLINLFTLCKVELLKKHGIDRILQPFMNDIATLESETGFVVKVDGFDKTFRGTIGPFSTDNLGAHMIGGYNESFNCLRICRVCMATKNDIQTSFSEDEFQLRTKAAHDRHCELVSEDATMSTAYGVKRASALNQSKFFHVVDGLDLDIMHDQLEGVLPLEVKMLLQRYVQEEKIFTLDTVNERIINFEYGVVDRKNRPSPLKQQVLNTNSATISQTATQMWCLARVLPLLIGDLIPEDDSHWQNFLLLLQIEEIIFAPTTSPELAAYLAVLVGEYLENFSKLYTRVIIPKQHYMVHYPRQIVRRGPLVRSWAMRFEAKHSYFKKLVDKLNNFKNIDYSLAKRHQALQAYLLQTSAGSLFNKAIKYGPGERVTIADAGLEDELEDVTPTSLVTVCKWVVVGGTRYSVGCVLITALHYGIHTFGLVKKIMVETQNEVVVFQCKILQVLKHEEHLNAHQVSLSEEVKYIKHEDLVDFHPLGLHKGFECNSTKSFVVLRYRVDYI